jgi:hypothetical protein
LVAAPYVDAAVLDEDKGMVETWGGEDGGGRREEGRREGGRREARAKEERRRRGRREEGEYQPAAIIVTSAFRAIKEMRK